MKASRLAELGFKEWHSLQGVSASDLVAVGETVFMVGLRGPRSRGTPEIQYIGRAKRPMRKILGGLVAGYGGKETLRIHKELATREALGRAEISWKTSKDSKAEQRKLLSEYTGEHGVVPPWNRKGKAKTANKKTAKAKAASERARTARARPAKTKPAAKKAAVATQSGNAKAR